MTLPLSVTNLVENQPIEDILLAILRRGLPEVPIRSLIPDKPPVEGFFVLARRIPGVQYWRGDPRFTDEARFMIQCYAQDPDGDKKGALLSEAVRVILRTAWLEHWSFPGLGSVIQIEMKHEPARRADWATSAGPVQYADLPHGYWRYESDYLIKIRKPN